MKRLTILALLTILLTACNSRVNLSVAPTTLLCSTNQWGQHTNSYEAWIHPLEYSSNEDGRTIYIIVCKGCSKRIGPITEMSW